jgi:two-component system sensor histidine kinase HydH
LFLTPGDKRIRISILAALSALTLGIHYGWVLEPIFGHAHWVHAIHGRFCYIPIVIGASWFGLRGGLFTAASISILVLPLVIGSDLSAHDLVSELVEILFYFAIATLAGALVDRQMSARSMQAETQLQLERSQKLSTVGQIAAGVAHEIKNPLASIKGAFEIMNDETTSEPEKEEFRQIVSREIRRIDGTVTEFLEFARPRETKFEELDPAEVLRASLRQIEAQASAAGIKLIDDFEAGLRIRGDKEKIHQMMLNLLLNAVNASDKGSTIHVSLKKPNHDLAVVTVKDSGKGMSESDLERVFEPFFTTNPSGTGLGMAIVKSIVDSHNGGITLHSEERVGTEVVIRIPLIRG